MKTIVLFLAMLISGIALAQTGINYKAIVKDGGGNVLANETINIRFSIVNDTEATTVYQERFLSEDTNANGLIILDIGGGIPSIGFFSDVQWKSGNLFSLMVEVDLIDGSGYINMGTSQFNTVPFAQSASSIMNIPTRTLEVAGVGPQKIRINSENNNEAALELMREGSSTDWKIEHSGSWFDILTSDDEFVTDDIMFTFRDNGRLGVNNTNPLEELHVTGTIRSTDLAGVGTRNVVANSNGNLIPDSQTKYLSIGPAAFVSYQEGRNPRISTDFLTAGTGPPEAALFVASLNLPQGATITSFKCYFVDNVNPTGLSAAIISRRHTSTSNETFDALSSNSLSSSSSLQSVEKTTFSIGTINNAVYSYGIELDSFAWSLSNMRFYSILISYTLP